MRLPAELILALSHRALLVAFAIMAAGGCAGQSAGGVVEEPAYIDRTVETLPIRQPSLESQDSHTEALLQAVSAVSDDVAWVSGHQGTYSWTIDGGATWETAVVPGADTLQFRDVHAASASEAWLLAAGSGELSKVFHTDDAGATWTLQWTNPEPDGFYDCFDFWDSKRGALYGDAVEGGLRIMRTEDGGETWIPVDWKMLPAANEGEGGFAASGTCLTVGEEGRGWISTGNASPSRLLVTADYGRSWQAFEVSMVPGGPGSGLFSVSFRGKNRGLVFGGSLNPEAEPGPRVALTVNSGDQWFVRGQPTFDGAIFGGAWVRGTEIPLVVLVAPGGADYSVDGARTWLSLDTEAYWGLGFSSPDAGWLVGPGGRITKVSF